MFWSCSYIWHSLSGGSVVLCTVLCATSILHTTIDMFSSCFSVHLGFWKLVLSIWEGGRKRERCKETLGNWGSINEWQLSVCVTWHLDYKWEADICACTCWEEDRWGFVFPKRLLHELQLKAMTNHKTFWSLSKTCLWFQEKEKFCWSWHKNMAVY